MSDNDASDHHAGYLLRACEHCRQRKIKCDRKNPCTSCQGLRIECKPSQKPSTPRPRPGSSGPSNNDRHMVAISRRLASIETALKALAVNSASTSSRTVVEASSVQDSPHNVVAPFEGESSFEVQSAQASEAANRTAAVLGATTNVELKTVLSSLLTSLEAHNTDSRSHESFLSPPSTANVEPLALPPVELISTVVKTIKVYPPIFMQSFLGRTLAQTEQLCQKCYFPSSQLPAGSRTLLFGILYFTLRDYVHIKEAGFKEPEILPSLQLCELNFYRAVESYTTLTVPTLENVQALYLASCRAQEESKLNLVWTYLSAATTMCHTLGLHRKVSLQRDSPDLVELKRHVFWNVYMSERNISLMLGRTSNLKDEEIDQPFFSLSRDPRQGPWDRLVIGLAKIGTIQGQTYDELYSFASSQRSVLERSSSAQRLAANVLHVTEDEIKTIRSEGAWDPHKLRGMLNAADAIAYTTITTIFRAQTNPKASTEISADCFTYARLALEAHVRSSNDLRPDQPLEKLDYVTWVLLYYSFTPFVIHFTRTISTLDQDDLTLLAQAVDMLDNVKHVNKGSERIHKVSKAFYDTAEVLVQSRQAVQGLQQHDDGGLVFTNDVDAAASGTDWANFTEAFPSIPTNADMSMFLGNWLGDGRPVHDMLGLEGLDSGAVS